MIEFEVKSKKQHKRDVNKIPQIKNVEIK